MKLYPNRKHNNNILILLFFVFSAAPRFLDPSKMQKTLIAVPVGNSIKMDCTAIGNPKPTVLWYMNGKVFSERGGQPFEQDPYKHVIILKDSVPSDKGKYTCNVSNHYGWVNYTYRVDVQGKGFPLKYLLYTCKAGDWMIRMISLHLFGGYSN